MSRFSTLLPGHFHYIAACKARQPQVALHEILGALSHAIDMTAGQPAGHAIRCTWMGMQIAAQLKMTDEARADLYYTLMMKDLGCSSNAARISALYLADDISFKREYRKIGSGLSAVLRLVIQQTGLQAGLAERIRATLYNLRNGDQFSRELIETRCHKGADIAAKLRFSPAVQDGIRALDEHWDGGGKPLGLASVQIPLAARIALLCQVVDVYHQESGPDAALAEARRRAGGWFDPNIVAAFEKAAAADTFWISQDDPEIATAVYAMAPQAPSFEIDEAYLDDIAEAFADVIDAKSPYTADHSRRVTLYADVIAEELGLGAAHRRWLRRAALLHDIGKLAVSNQILDKPGRPTEEEWRSIRDHPAHTIAILSRVSAFADLAIVAGGHHERLDGTGYPEGLTAEDLCFEAMILATADVYDALTADRPYRAAMPHSAAMAILHDGVGTAHHGLCVSALEAGLNRLAVLAN
jgi:putative nucleotidyltransferase with HDIG domain